MKEIFDINRFYKTVRNDLNTNGRRYFIALLIFMAIMPLYLLLRFILGGGPISINTRIISFVILAFILIFLAPFSLYKDANHRKRGLDFIMLPASGLEKFLSMFLICSIILPVTLIISYLFVDTILVAIPNRFYKDYIFSADLISWDNIRGFLSIILIQSTALCGNMLFRKNKVTKTILSFIAILFVVGALISIYIYENEIKKRYPEIEMIKKMKKEKRKANVKVINNSRVINGEELDKEIPNESLTFSIGQRGEVDKEGKSSSKNLTYKIDTTNTTIYRSGKSYSMNGEEFRISLINNHKFFYYSIIVLFYLFYAYMYFLTFWRIKKEQL